MLVFYIIFYSSSKNGVPLRNLWISRFPILVLNSILELILTIYFKIEINGENQSLPMIKLIIEVFASSLLLPI